MAAQSSAADAANVASAKAQSTADRITRWVDENRNLAIALGLGSLVAGGAGAYYFLGPSSRRSKGKDGGDSASSQAAPSSKKKKDKKRGGKQAGAAEGGADDALKRPDGPLLEEASEAELMKLSVAEIEALPEARRQTLAEALKTEGNKLYGANKAAEATEYYTKAIAASPRAVYYSNRAACYMNQGQYQNVITDCDAALRLDRAYAKALNRRAGARERLGMAEVESQGADSQAAQQKIDYLWGSVCDFTFVALLGGFRDTTATESVERVLRALSTFKAQETLRTRELQLPSATFITAYLEAFRPKPHPTLPESPSQGDQTLLKAFEALSARDYPHASSLFNEAVAQGPSTDELKALAYSMTGTFKFIIGTPAEALRDLDEATRLLPKHVQSWVKKASVHMELGDQEQAFADFNKAIEADKDDPDIYYHRGQVQFILSQWSAALSDYERSTKLDDSFIFSQVQHAVCQYKMGEIGASTAAFRRIMRRFDNSSEACNYYGELLLDQGNHDEAIAQFDRAIGIESRKERNQNVLPMVNKALAVFQARQAIDEAMNLCRQALGTDPYCDVAVATLAQLSLQRGQLHEAVGYFERNAAVARTETELVNAYTYAMATRAQLEFVESFPEQASALPGLANGLA